MHFTRRRLLGSAAMLSLVGLASPIPVAAKPAPLVGLGVDFFEHHTTLLFPDKSRAQYNRSDLVHIGGASFSVKDGAKPIHHFPD